MFTNCSKIQQGFISPTMQYSTQLFVVPKGEVASSVALNADGTSLPISVKWLHIYDSTGRVVDTIFQKLYPANVWTAGYNPKTDTSFAAIFAKITTGKVPPLEVNEGSGQIVSTPGSLYVPDGNYSIDIQISNKVGVQVLKNAMTISFQSVRPLQTSPETGAYSLSLLYANTATGGGTLFNGNNNPFVVETIDRISDTPNLFVLKVLDKNGVIFSGAGGEIMKRPNSGLNPNPPYLQNLQDYAPDTFTEPEDGSLRLVYPIVPFPIGSLGNGYNMYYRLPTQYVTIDSTKGWSSNTAGNYYKGTSDSHFLGYYTNNKFDYAVRIPMRIMVPGSYQLTVKLLNVTHR